MSMMAVLVVAGQMAAASLADDVPTSSSGAGILVVCWAKFTTRHSFCDSAITATMCHFDDKSVGLPRLMYP